MHEFPCNTPPRLSVEFGAGTITIEASDRATTTVELGAVRDDEASRELIAESTVVQRGDDIVVLVPRRRGRVFGRTPALTLAVTTPTDAKLKLSASSADITATGRFGTSALDAGSGDIRIGDVGDSLKVRSGSGNVEVGHVAKDADVKTGSGDVALAAVDGSSQLQSGSGNITLREGGSALRVATGSGDVSVTQAPGDVEATTGSGDIALERVERGDVRVRAASGDVRVGVADGTAAWLEVHTVSGTARSDLETSDAPDEQSPQVRLRLNTVSGDIDVVRA
ncbi:MAG: DUF4097 family beta strand repeat protein [Acidimicrobiia bacterium]|nr:DUF4097 family beta strand repeat protein [Acidimicrobiia bacterium]